MITRQNFQSVLDSITAKDKKRILNSDKEYIVIELDIFNAGSITKVILTNDFNRYKNVSNNCGCILETQEVHSFLS